MPGANLYFQSWTDTYEYPMYILHTVHLYSNAWIFHCLPKAIRQSSWHYDKKFLRLYLWCSTWLYDSIIVSTYFYLFRHWNNILSHMTGISFGNVPQISGFSNEFRFQFTSHCLVTWWSISTHDNLTIHIFIRRSRDCSLFRMYSLLY